jgi:hypothetical protein
VCSSDLGLLRLVPRGDQADSPRRSPAAAGAPQCAGGAAADASASLPLRQAADFTFLQDL